MQQSMAGSQSAAATNPLRRLEALGQSIWLDFTRRSMTLSGELQRLIDEDGVSGVTSNPSIFEKSIAGSHDYDDAVHALALEGQRATRIYEALAIEDLQYAADLFRPIYERTSGRDGFVSMEVSPHLVHDTEGTVEEARRFWAALARPNVMIKVPATDEGLPAIRQLIGEGININITLLFGLERYKAVLEAYLGGLEDRLRRGQPIDRVASVASFFLSRIDVLVDPILEKIAAQDNPRRNGNPSEVAPAAVARSLLGQTAIACAKVAYHVYSETFSGERARSLIERGGHTQKLLWASTSTKNPAYSDVKYVEALIGPDTVNTVPLETLHAYRDHGNPTVTLDAGLAAAQQVLAGLARVGIDLDAVVRQLEDEGAEKFRMSYDRLMAALEEKRSAALAEPVDHQRLDLAGYESDVQETVAELADERFGDRLWRKDPSLWKADPSSQAIIHNALGWLHVAEKEEENLRDLAAFFAEVKAAGFSHVLDMGMGGSTLAPLVFRHMLPSGQGGLSLTVLDTTDPATILGIERSLPLDRTLFLVASKSGTTAEPLAFADYFYARVRELKDERAGENFVAITDPGTPLVTRARQEGYRRVFTNFSDIGGRYSALSCFGLLPAVLMGANAGELLARALRMVHASAASVPLEQNPGVVLGAAIGQMARSGRDKLTFVIPPALATMGLWLEQLLAESTGKEGMGILPVAGEPLGPPEVYGEDRVFVCIRSTAGPDHGLDEGVAALHKAGYPLITLDLDDPLDLGQELFRWEIAIATAGAVLDINPFDQPNVQESKDNTSRLLEQVEQGRRLPEDPAAVTADPLRFFGSEPAKSGRDYLRSFLARARPGDYVAFQAYLPESPTTGDALRTLRARVRDALHVATTLGYGPRYLHSTGQLHKGGPNTGLFIQLTAMDREDAPIPGRPYSFGVLKAAQALGDFEALRRHGRRVVRVDLGEDVERGLAALAHTLEASLAR